MNPFVRLDADNQEIGGEPRALSLTKQQRRNPLEPNSNFGDTLRQAFARSQVKRHICPTPVVELLSIT